MSRLKHLLALLTSLLALLLAGCDLPFYWQAAKGQMDLLQRRQPIDDLIANPATPDALKQQLEQNRHLHEPGRREDGHRDAQRRLDPPGAVALPHGLVGPRAHASARFGRARHIQTRDRAIAGVSSSSSGWIGDSG